MKKVVKEKIYNFSFTGASALIPETIVVAEQYDILRDWKTVEGVVRENNLLNKVKHETFRRQFREIRDRLSLLTDAQLDLMVNGTFDDAKVMILLALCKKYSFMKDFVVEVLRTKYQLFDKVLSESDYSRFIQAKSLAHPELESLSELTGNKVRQVLFKILELMGLITSATHGMILKPMLSKESVDVISTESPMLLAVFLFSNEEISLMLQKRNDAR